MAYQFRELPKKLLERRTALWVAACTMDSGSKNKSIMEQNEEQQ